ncbi:superoxide dismutase family protein, partial [Streptomyces broussonetiae]
VYAGALAAALFATGSASTPSFSLDTSGVFTPSAKSAASKALTYDQKLVPTGAMINVRQQSLPNGTTKIELRVAGLVPGHQYGAHIHQKACGVKPDDAGKHYQDKAGTDAAHVNNKNEVWLDFKTDAHGIGQATTQHGWAFRKGQAGSLVIHSQPGTKGSRAACFSVPFGGAS